MPGYGTWAKMVGGGAALCIGGPALVIWVTPTEEELFKRYNPELQRRSLENRVQKQQDFDNFVGQLKEYSKSDKPIWAAIAEGEENKKQVKRDEAASQRLSVAAEVERRRQEMKSSS
ncbi:CBP4-domain-containing protein [Tothia fuscella]|uniref:Cytochrome b mRNA-processing protein 4 n=1 Tax=Tothia fuscella TaxID=1048955 RepID=A0A9P4NRJ6_9PEZI|nr:CBP4-domain-containing protein [Tothia fuscella]